MDKLFEDISDDLDRNLAIIYSEFPKFEFSKEILYRNQRYIRSVLNPVRGIIAYCEEISSGNLKLRLGNPHYLPTVVLDAVCGDYTLQPTERQLVLAGKTETSTIQFQPLTFIAPE